MAPAARTSSARIETLAPGKEATIPLLATDDINLWVTRYHQHQISFSAFRLA